MTDKSKPEELSKEDLDSVQGGYTEVEWTAKGGKGFTATDDLANVKGGKMSPTKEGYTEVEWTLKDAKDSGDGK